jgi:putative transposase
MMMKAREEFPFDPHHRKSIRLKGYDYSLPGYYFVTVLAWRQNSIFSIIRDNTVVLNEYWELISRCWNTLPMHYLDIDVDLCVIMPNHIHGIIFLKDQHLDKTNVRAGLRPAPTTLSEIIRAFKSFSARHINQLRRTPGLPVWHRNYYERIIRNDDELNAIRKYIKENPANWEHDIRSLP